MEDTSNPRGETRQQKNEMLFDIYKKEADEFMSKRLYDKALHSYNLAVKLHPGDKRALIGRSRCYLYKGKTSRAMQDVEKSLSIDVSDTDAVYMKAEILYLTGNYQLASVYYKRGHKLDPQNPYFTEGIQRTAEAQHKFAGGMVAKNKLSEVGDLSFFLNNKRRPVPLTDLEHPGLASGREAELPSAGFSSRNHCQLVRISRKPRFPGIHSFNWEDTWLRETGGLRGLRQEGKEENGTRGPLRQPDEDTVKKILGELYGDRQYLQRLQTNLPGGRAERDLTLLTDEGLEFLRERSVFWDTLGPLPPPVPSRRGLIRERSLGALSTDTSSHTVSKDLPWNRRRREQTEIHRDVTQVDFQFRSHLATRQRNRRESTDSMFCGSNPDSYNTITTYGGDNGRWASSGVSLTFSSSSTANQPKPGRTMFVGFQDPEVERRQQLTNFVNTELDLIDEAFKAKDYEECLHKAEVCLHAVSTLPDGGLNKSEMLASLHSCVGNACIALHRYELAFEHHKTALDIGERAKNSAIIARSLGHMGRMYIIQQKFNKALEVFARKAPMCASLEEVTQTFHEIGNCFLVLANYEYARDCGRKSLRAAKEADLPFFEQQAWILIAIAEAKQQHLKEAYKAFNGALQVAIRKDDEESQAAITAAMDHLSGRIDKLLRKKSLVNQRMLLRTKAKEITQEDLHRPKPPAVRTMKHRRPPISRQKTTLAMDHPATKDPAGDVQETTEPPDSLQACEDFRERMRVTSQGVGVRRDPGSDDEQSGQETGSDQEGDDQVELPGDRQSLHLALHLSHPSLQADDSALPTERTDREGMTVQSERLVRDDKLFTTVGANRDDLMIQTERVERDEERKRFRREATLGDINIDDSTYQQFARETSFNRASTLRAKQIYTRQAMLSRQSLLSRHSMSRQSMSRQGTVSRQGNAISRQSLKQKQKKSSENVPADYDNLQQHVLARPDTDRGVGDGSSEPDMLMAFHPLPPITPRALLQTPQDQRHPGDSQQDDDSGHPSISKPSRRSRRSSRKHLGVDKDGGDQLTESTKPSAVEDEKFKLKPKQTKIKKRVQKRTKGRSTAGKTDKGKDAAVQDDDVDGDVADDDGQVTEADVSEDNESIHEIADDDDKQANEGLSSSSLLEENACYFPQTDTAVLSDGTENRVTPDPEQHEPHSHQQEETSVSYHDDGFLELPGISEQKSIPQSPSHVEGRLEDTNIKELLHRSEYEHIDMNAIHQTLSTNDRDEHDNIVISGELENIDTAIGKGHVPQISDTPETQERYNMPEEDDVMELVAMTQSDELLDTDSPADNNLGAYDVMDPSASEEPAESSVREDKKRGGYPGFDVITLSPFYSGRRNPEPANTSPPISGDSARRNPEPANTSPEISGDNGRKNPETTNASPEVAEHSGERNLEPASTSPEEGECSGRRNPEPANPSSEIAEDITQRRSILGKSREETADCNISRSTTAQSTEANHHHPQFHHGPEHPDDEVLQKPTERKNPGDSGSPINLTPGATPTSKATDMNTKLTNQVRDKNARFEVMSLRKMSPARPDTANHPHNSDDDSRSTIKHTSPKENVQHMFQNDQGHFSEEAVANESNAIDYQSRLPLVSENEKDVETLLDRKGPESRSSETRDTMDNHREGTASFTPQQKNFTRTAAENDTVDSPKKPRREATPEVRAHSSAAFRTMEEPERGKAMTTDAGLSPIVDTPERVGSNIIAAEGETTTERDSCQPADDFPSRSQTVASWVQVY